MSRYNQVMLKNGVSEKELLTAVKRVDRHISKAVISAVISDEALPTRPTMQAICDTLNCSTLDIYSRREITLTDIQGCAVNSKPKKPRRPSDIYNLSVEIPRDLAERVFSKESLRKLGYLSKTDLIRGLLKNVDTRLSHKCNK